MTTNVREPSISSTGSVRASTSQRLGKTVKELRERRGMTKSALAERAALTPSYISRLEKGDYQDRSLTLATCIGLAHGLKVALKELLADAGLLSASDTSSLRLVLERKKGLSPDQAELVERIVEGLSEEKPKR
jgi:transcriptional regulator with XRE-family HTH domain